MIQTLFAIALLELFVIVYLLIRMGELNYTIRQAKDVNQMLVSRLKEIGKK